MIWTFSSRFKADNDKYSSGFLPFLFMRKKCNANGQERIAISETAATWRNGAVT